MMRLLAYKIRVALDGLLGVCRGLLRRARHGPTLPSWTLSEELLVSVSRATAKASARHIEFMAPRGSGLQVPLDRASRAALNTEHVDLGGVRAERFSHLGLPQPAGAVLLWPYADFTFSGESIRSNGDIDMLPIHDLGHVWGPAYVGDADPSDPLVSPALADLSGLPPLLIIAGGAESLLSCAERIAANARSGGVPAQLNVFPEKVHGWMMLPKLEATLEAIEVINGWIAERLGHEPDPVSKLD